MPFPKTFSPGPFYGILDAGYVSAHSWVSKYDGLVAGGASIIQIRAKNVTLEQTAQLLEAIVRHRERQPSIEQPHLIVNDHLELCLSYPDLGLHVGQDDLPATEARKKLGPDRILGLSTHSPEQALAAIALGPNVLSYFAVGPVFPTKTKPDYIPVGLDLVRFVAKQRPSLPFYCIGGITRGNIAEVRSAGGTRIVTVSDSLCDSDTAMAVRESIEAIRS